jgi:two-component system, CitB family, response regulator MalR
MMTNVLIIEDDPMVAELNRTFVESIPNMKRNRKFQKCRRRKKIFQTKKRRSAAA